MILFFLNYVVAANINHPKIVLFLQNLAKYHSIVKEDMQQPLKYLYDDLYVRYNSLALEKKMDCYMDFSKIISTEEERMDICQRLFDGYSEVLLCLLPKRNYLCYEEKEGRRRVWASFDNNCFGKAEHEYPGLFHEVAESIDKFFMCEENISSVKPDGNSILIANE
ncbi:hypothetical protein H312_02265, partial [Anncaliia algerae PRA339]